MSFKAFQNESKTRIGIDQDMEKVYIIDSNF